MKTNPHDGWHSQQPELPPRPVAENIGVSVSTIVRTNAWGHVRQPAAVPARPFPLWKGWFASDRGLDRRRQSISTLPLVTACEGQLASLSRPRGRLAVFLWERPT
jgi:hypothetical protein